MDTSKLKNGKYFLGKFDEPNEYRGWFIGSFFDKKHPCCTDNVEIMYKEHQPGDISQPHYHQQKIELIIILSGKAKCKVNEREMTLTTGNFLFVDTNNIIEAEFLKKSKILVIHSPSLPTDKIKLDS